MTENTYPKPAVGAPDLPALELEVLDYWASDDTFRASIARRADAPEYVFYDGPPFANGLPHYGHLLTGYVKDIVPRYRTMRGYKVERRFGWDTHGLPAELEVERQLGITDKSQIDAMGIAAFNDACRESVLRYTDEWRAYVTRQARWVDFDHDYKTLDLPYMESVIWAFKQLWDKGLAYEGYRVLPYCWRDETPLSNHELRMDDDVYQSRQDPAVTVGFAVTEGDLAGAHLLVWTTTPWTLPSNQAVAVNPDVTYVQVRAGEHRVILAEARLAAYAREFGEDPEVLGSYRGSELTGTRYRPPFPYFMDSRQRFSGTRGQLRHDRRRHRDRPSGTGVRRGRQGDRRRGRHRAGDTRRRQGPIRRHRPRLPGPACLRGQCADHPRPEEPHGSGRRQRCGADPPGDLRPPLPALLAVP